MDSLQHRLANMATFGTLLFCWACAGPQPPSDTRLIPSQGPSETTWTLEKAAVDQRWALYSRKPEGQSLLEFQLLGLVTAGLEPLQAAARQRILSTEDIDGEAGEWKKVLIDTSKQIVTHSLAKMPFPFSDREMCERFRLDTISEGRGRKITWQEDWSVAPKDTGSSVRMPVTRGWWRFVLQQDGHVLVTYQVLFDPGGNMPHFLVNSMAGDFLVEEFLKVRSLSQRASGADEVIEKSQP